MLLAVGVIVSWGKRGRGLKQTLKRMMTSETPQGPFVFRVRWRGHLKARLTVGPWPIYKHT